jgi:hypothetical protein
VIAQLLPVELSKNFNVFNFLHGEHIGIHDIPDSTGYGKCIGFTFGPYEIAHNGPYCILVLAECQSYATRLVVGRIVYFCLKIKPGKKIVEV